MANILAVDDEKAILNMIESILVKDSHTVTKIDEPTKIEMDKLSHFLSSSKAQNRQFQASSRPVILGRSVRAYPSQFS